MAHAGGPVSSVFGAKQNGIATAQGSHDSDSALQTKPWSQAGRQAGIRLAFSTNHKSIYIPMCQIPNDVTILNQKDRRLRTRVHRLKKDDIKINWKGSPTVPIVLILYFYVAVGTERNTAAVVFWLFLPLHSATWENGKVFLFFIFPFISSPRYYGPHITRML